MATAAIQIGLGHLLKEIKLKPYRIFGVGCGELVAAHLAEFLSLKQTMMGLFYVACNLVKSNSRNWENLGEDIFGEIGKCIPANEKILRQNCAKYVTSRSAWNNSRKDGVGLMIPGGVRDKSQYAMSLISVDSQDYVVDLLSNLGRYEFLKSFLRGS